MIKFKNRPMLYVEGHPPRALSVVEFLSVIKLIRMFAGNLKAREYFDKYAEFVKIDSADSPS